MLLKKALNKAIKSTPEGAAAVKAAKERVQAGPVDAEAWNQELEGVTAGAQAHHPQVRGLWGNGDNLFTVESCR